MTIPKQCKHGQVAMWCDICTSMDKPLQKSDLELLSEDEQIFQRNLKLLNSHFGVRGVDLELKFSSIDMMHIMNAVRVQDSLKSQQSQAEVEKLKRQLICDVCLGSAMENCACNGTGNILTTLTTIRQINFKLQQRCEELEKYAIHKPNCARLQRPFGASVTVCNNSITCTCGLDKLFNPSQT